MVALVPLVFSKALDRFILATINGFREPFSYQSYYPVTTQYTAHGRMSLPRGSYPVYDFRQC